ncbi:MAG: DNA polymerase III subunit gamma/tau [Melioribacteraceae bacterium]|jgi:DNA polymerase-3 subunit gamma/tau|nr:DNA polymerase III subunit gamma/tau [Melioribacteraceae bacterium]
MNYVVTARKWRPQIFEEVVGQEHISKTVKNAIINNRIAHAYLFAGPRGVGKTTTARILAKALNCKNNIDGEPCNKCDTCNSFNSSQSLDIIEIDGASNRRIEEIRSLREAVKYAPTTGTYKIFIIDEVHMLTTESFNALLKTLEEPPEHAIFIFATTDVHKVPLTIISRCQRFDFRRIELDAIKNQLTKIANSDSISIDDQALTFIAKKADGALRDAQSLFDQVVSFGGKDIDATVVSKMLNLIDEDIYFKISDAILNKHYVEAYEISKSIYDNGWNYIDFINGLLEHFRNILTTILMKDTSFVESSQQVKKMYLEYIDAFSESDLLRILKYLNKVEKELKASQNQKLLMEISLSHLIGLESTTTITELIKNIQNGKFPENAEKKKCPQRIQSINNTETGSIERREEKIIITEEKKTSDFEKPEVRNISNVDVNISTEESSLINAIINELGGREFK